jgi:hypothetical protein
MTPGWQPLVSRRRMGSRQPHSAVLSTAGERFFSALEVVGGARRRLSIDECFDALYEADPYAFDAPDKRARLAHVLHDCVAAGVIELSAVTDRGRPSLPRSVRRTGADAPALDRGATSWPWRAELAWAAELSLTRGEFESLRAVQEFLRSGGSERPLVPHRERSLELFGYEKALDRLSRGRLFATGRLALATLRCWWAPPPLAVHRVGQGTIALVVENPAAWHSCIATLPGDGPVGLVAYGAGRAFGISVTALAEFADVSAICYAGDLDAAGLGIPIAADAAANARGLPSVRPALSLWRLLFEVGASQQGIAVPSDVATELAAWLPAELRDRAVSFLTAGRRLPQEAVGLEVLSRGGQWWEELR